MLVLPFFIVGNLRLPLGQRIGVITVLSLSFFACIAGVLRSILTAEWPHTYDEPRVSWKFGFAAVVEVNLGMVSGKAPDYPP